MAKVEANRASRRFTLNVIGGCGHVGLPLSLALADKGHTVCIYDVNRSAIETIRAGKMPFLEAGAQPLLERVLASGRLTFSTEPESISAADIAVLIIGTPVDDHLNPEFPVIRRTIDDLAPYFRDGQVLVMRSTVYPGISEKVQRAFEQRGKKVHVAFCPERIAEGMALEELETLPQIVSGFSPEAVQAATELFSGFGCDIIPLEPLEAELTKLFTNSYRYIKFAIANQFFQIANDYGLDFYRLHHAMTHDYPRARDLPRPGLTAGPCLFKDTMQLAAFNNNNFLLGHAAMLVNEGLPNYIVQQLKQSEPLAKRCVGILGMAFKANSDDKRESLSYKLRKILEIEAQQVLCSDLYIRDQSFVSADELFARCDIVILGAPHREYKHLDHKGKRVIDVWNFFGKGGNVS